MSAQYRLVVAKKEERVEGADDASIVFSVPVAVAVADGFDATVEYMRGKLKATGHTGRVLDLLKTGEVDAAFARLVAGL